MAALSSSRDEVAHSPCVRASNITTREYCNKLLLLKQLDALRDLLKQVLGTGTVDPNRHQNRKSDPEVHSTK